MPGAMVMFAATEGGGSFAPFYIAGGLLVVWALLVAVFGLQRHADWPSRAGRNGVLAVTTLLVALTCTTVVVAS